MILPETENVRPVTVSVRDVVVSNELRLSINYGSISLDQATAEVFLPVLIHFINTGEMLK
ncbi:hypothetical protein [Hafnia phage TS33]|nr:hypothetical protein [Hafnia phage TS33]